MKKVYARQIPPEYQESPLFYDTWPENVFVFGNRDYNQHAERLEEIQRGLEDISTTFDDIRAGYLPGENLHAVLWYHLPRDDGRGYSRAERLELVKLAKQYTESSAGSYDEEQALLLTLELVTGTEYESGTIRGCCQGDWQNIMYPAEYGRAWLEHFEAEYFNTGSEWMVHDEEGEPESPEEISGYTVYCHGWSYDQLRAEIADVAGCDPADVVLYAFSSWSRSANYEVA